MFWLEEKQLGWEGGMWWMEEGGGGGGGVGVGKNCLLTVKYYYCDQI